MGPLAGVELQRLIIQHTPAKKDQDHLQVICFTNPQIADRTAAIKKNKTKEMTEDVIASIKELQKAKPDIAVIACHTAHTQIEEIQKSTKLPLLSLVDATAEAIEHEMGRFVRCALLATDGTIDSNIYQGHDKLKNVDWVIPSKDIQEKSH